MNVKILGGMVENTKKNKKLQKTNRLQFREGIRVIGGKAEYGLNKTLMTHKNEKLSNNVNDIVLYLIDKYNLKDNYIRELQKLYYKIYKNKETNEDIIKKKLTDKNLKCTFIEFPKLSKVNIKNKNQENIEILLYDHMKKIEEYYDMLAYELNKLHNE